MSQMLNVGLPGEMRAKTLVGIFVYCSKYVVFTLLWLLITVACSLLRGGGGLVDTIQFVYQTNKIVMSGGILD